MQLKAIAAAALTFAVAATARADIEFFDFNLSGAEEVPPVATSAIGFASLEFDTTSMTFDLDLFIEGIVLGDITGAHIHRGPFGQNGPIVVDLLDLGDFLDGGGNVSFLSLLDVPLGSAFTPMQLRGEQLYVNVHTRLNPSGEIRGQIPAPASALALAGLLVATRRRRA